MAFLIIMVWLLEFVLALAFLGLVEERMNRSETTAPDIGRSPVPRP